MNEDVSVSLLFLSTLLSIFFPVQCGKGTHRNDTTMSCQFCPVGKYQESPGATSCTDCGSGKTTQTFGSYSSSDCKGQCNTRERY